MKGIMVPLLVFWMTGIVIGQQRDSSNQFGSNSFAVSPQNNSQNPGRFGPTPAQPQAAQDSQLAPFELEVTQEKIWGIKNDEEGFLQSRIEPIDPKTGKPLPRSVVNGISLVLSGSNSTNLPGERFSSAPQSHFVQGKNILAFGITDKDLANLQTRKLNYEFGFTERGKYDEVVIFYVPPTAANSGPTPDDATNANVAFGPRNNNASSAPLLPLPAPEYEPGEQNFMGPVHPSQLNQTTPGGLGSGFAGSAVPPSTWVPSTDRNLTNPAFPNSQNQYQPASRQPTFEEQVAFRRSQVEQERESKELNKQKALLDAYRQELIQDAAAVERQRQEFAQQRYRDPIRTSRPNEIAPDFSKITGPVVGSNIGTGPLVDRPVRMASLDPRLLPVGTGDSSTPNRAGNQPMPQPSTGGIKNYTASMPGTNLDEKSGTNGNKQDTTKTDKRVEGFVMFMLFCSLGLNLYLAWISRGFYVRYNELADELRETFTATM